MTEQASSLVTLYKHGWENYQQALVTTIASLSSEHLALPIAAHQRSIGELLAGSSIAKNSSSRGEQNGSSLCGWTNGQQFCQKLRHSRAYASKAEQSRIQRWLSTGLSSQPLDAICVQRKDKKRLSNHTSTPSQSTRCSFWIGYPKEPVQIHWLLCCRGGCICDSRPGYCSWC